MVVEKRLMLTAIVTKNWKSDENNNKMQNKLRMLIKKETILTHNKINKEPE